MSGTELGDDRIKIRIDGDWSATEFAEFFTQMAFLYKAAAFGGIRIDGQTAVPLMSSRRYFRRRRESFYNPFDPLEWDLQDEADEGRKNIERMLDAYAHMSDVPLTVVRIKYGSPGFVDLAGLGRALREVRIFLLGITNLWLHKRDREIARASASQDVIAKKIKNAENLLKLGDKAGLDPVERQALVRAVLDTGQYVDAKILSKQITGVK